MHTHYVVIDSSCRSYCQTERRKGQQLIRCCLNYLNLTYTSIYHAVYCVKIMGALQQFLVITLRHVQLVINDPWNNFQL